jgi:hypothetical protein
MYIENIENIRKKNIRDDQKNKQVDAILDRRKQTNLAYEELKKRY